MSAETLGKYLEIAFDHFTATPNKPFNFLSASLLRSPVTQTFKDHICKLAVQYMTIYPTKPGPNLFEGLSPWVASCIFLNSHRFELPNSDVAEIMFERYQHFCIAAQTEFYNRNWPCEAMDKRGNHCVNIKSTHAVKGHQDRSGKIFIANSDSFRLRFKSSFETDIDKQQANEAFSKKVLADLKRCIRKYKKLPDQDKFSNGDMKRAVADIHMSMLAEFNKEGVMSALVSHKTCFCCLASIPAHKLLCGHIICQLCLKDYSDKEGRPFCRVLKICPLCGPQGQSLRFEMKPPTAGLRILCLDGGGIRSIIQLEALKQLEHMIGLNIPIQNFFDLVVGTSGGGIVAAGIGLKNLTIDQCIEMFMTLADKAFKKRPAISWPIVGKLIMAHHHGRYKTSGLESVLKDIFGQDYIFGAERPACNKTIPSLKVAVTATSPGRHTFLLTNYNRPPPEKKCPKNITTQDSGENNDIETDDYKSPKEDGSENSIATEGTNDKDSLGSYQEALRNPEDEDPYPEEPEKPHEESPEETSEEGSNKSIVNLKGLNGETSKEVSEGDTGGASEETSEERPNKPTDTRSSYVFFRGENQATELRLWEAVRATSAAPGYFKSFSHSASKYTFDDGALRCNNPIFIVDKERKTLWPDLSKRDPDILLSIGTGLGSEPPEAVAAALPKRGIRSYIRKMINLGSAALMEDMDCEIMWQEFIDGLQVDEDTTERLKRYQRLNLNLKGPVPNLDEVDKMVMLQKRAQEFMPQCPKVKEIANILIGTLFYFELNAVSPDKHDSSLESIKQGWGLNCTGTIRCRLSSDDLANRIHEYGSSKGAPKKGIFLIGGENGAQKFLEARRPGAVTDKISYKVSFKLKHVDKDQKVYIYLSLWDDISKAVIISGFPRLLFSEAKLFCTRGTSRKDSLCFLPE